MHHQEDELCDLCLRDVSLPPEVRLHMRAEGSEEVVAVHDDVNTRIDDEAEQRLSISAVRHPNPAGPDDKSVMGIMQSGYMREFLMQQKEERIEEVSYSHPKVPIAEGQNTHRVLVGRMGHTWKSLI